VYSLPGVKGWRVAIQGGAALDFKRLFQKTDALVAGGSPRHTGGGPPIDPCLIDPELLVKSGQTVELRPSWNPLSPTRRGSLSIELWHRCAARFRTLRFELRRGTDVHLVGRLENTLIDVVAQTLTLSVELPATGQDETSGVLGVIVENGPVSRTVHPLSPPTIAIRETTYAALFGWWILAAAIGLTVVLLVLVHLARSRRHREQNDPVIVKLLGQPHGLPLHRGRRVTIGGASCDLVLGYVADGAVLGTLEWSGERRDEVTVRASDGVRMRIEGGDIVGAGRYRLGQTLEFADSTAVAHSVTLFLGTARDVGFGLGGRSSGDSTSGGPLASFDAGREAFACGAGAGQSGPGPRGGSRHAI
jgi:hypothetical protein